MNVDIQEHQSKVLCIFRHALFLLSAGFPLNATLLAEKKEHVNVSLSFVTVFGNSLVKELYRILHGNAQNGSVKYENTESDLFSDLPYSHHDMRQKLVV